MQDDGIVKPYASFRRGTARYFLPAFKALISAAALFYVAHNVDWAPALEALRSARGWFLVLTVTQMLLIPLLGGVRWQLVLRLLGQAASLPSLTRMFWVGMAFNQVLPSAVGGDALRVLLARRSGLDLTTSATSVLIERAMMLLSLVLVVVLAVWYAPADTLDPWLITVAEGLLGVGLAGLAAIAAVRWPLAKAPKLRVARFAVHLVGGLRAVAFSSGAVPLTILCLITNVNLAIAAWWLAQAFDFPLTLAQILAVISMVSLAMVIPVSIGGWGVREAAMVSLLGPLGVSGGIAFLFSVMFGLAVALSSLPGFVLLWWRPRHAEGGRAPEKASADATLSQARLDRNLIATV